MRTRCDVLVVGGGVAGIAAAVTAARCGAATLLVERNRVPGGAAIAGMHRAICGLYAAGAEEPTATLNGGLVREVCERLQVRAPEKHAQRVGRVYVLPFACRDLAAVFTSLLEQASGLTVWFDTRVTGVEREGNTIATVTVHNVQGALETAPAVVIDCSGDGVVIQGSGIAYDIAPVEQRQLAGLTVRFEGLQDADGILPFRVPYYLAQAVEQGTLPHFLKFTTFAPGDRADEGYCKLSCPPRGHPDAGDGRDFAARIHRYLVDVLPAFRNARIVETSPENLEREGVRLCGKYTLTREDVLGSRTFTDGVVRNAWPIELWDQRRGPTYEYLESGAFYEIPLGCLLSRDIVNLLCAGRCISVSHEALGSTRVMGPCLAQGEAAGREAVRQVTG
jgi:glycine/D-amino acid oxidase-like deaminating enzyme